MHAAVDWLPWGSDVLGLGSPNPVRPFDLLRFGRQPAEWDNDVVSLESCRSKGLRFHGRPKSWSDATDHERGLMQTLSTTKFTMAFTNRVSPGKNTHPEREYITGRWTDSLASGASVAGIPPRSESVRSLLWPEALVDIGTVHQEEGLEVLDAIVQAWTPERARLNYLRALEALDWRLRFKILSEALESPAPALSTALVCLKKPFVPPIRSAPIAETRRVKASSFEQPERKIIPIARVASVISKCAGTTPNFHTYIG